MRSGAIRFRGFTWRPVGRKNPTIAGLDLHIEPGERVLLVGPSGSGKSTLLHAAAGALGTTISGEASGDVSVEGRLGLVLQNPADAIVAERIGRDVAFGPENLGLPRDEIWRRVDRALSAVRLDYPRDHLTSALSGGEQQRLVLAGVLATEPDVVLLDEPTSMLDAVTAERARDAVLAAVGDRTLVVVEHRFEPWLDHVDRVVALDPGGVVGFDGSVGEFLALGGRPGLWMPGAPPPTPVDIPAAFVTPTPHSWSSSPVSRWSSNRALRYTASFLDTQEPERAVMEPSQQGASAAMERDHAPSAPKPVIASDVDVVLTTRMIRGTRRHPALSNFSARLDPGTTTAITGPSGAGKSTALLAMTGLVRVSGGTVTPDRTRMRSRDLAREIGWVPQNPELGFLTTSVREEVERTASALGVEVDADELLALVGLERFAPSHPYRLSGGEQRRLAMISALAHRPGFVALDEPTVGQDRDTWAVVTGWYTAAARAGAVVALATHDPDAPRDAEISVGEAVTAT
ncbi:ATP-binding cassette domain-containing protein [Aeromicrobium phragmitis]|uniref:ATP-binding cassette domain-containing protein n=1 Tax=Aeromicrobium phragmitis TaxID=2478914 RepID=A0A3L8PJV2_9ACTN|nr:ATP-binding cassette domain-containing protein [Aeromicrobium phragmitis]RLV54868.1 ATP-binding cassette domain-containing protein [Aeromicrobium phragmitis]